METEDDIELAAAAVRLSLDPSALRITGKFSAKLSFEERCAIYGLFKSGASPKILAIAFGLARPTVGYITRKESRYYKNVRAKYNELGHSFFIKTYVQDEHVKKVNEAGKSYQAKQTEAQLREAAAMASEDVGIGHRRAATHQGQHVLWSSIFNKTFVIEIRWAEADTHPEYPHEAGWALFFDDRGAEMMYADGVNDKALIFTTSKAAYDRYCEDLGLEPAVEI